MHVTQVLASSVALDKETLEVEGVFFFVAGEGFLAPSQKLKDEQKSSIRVSIPNLKQLLLSKMPAYGGGKYLYADAATLKGTLHQCKKGPFPFELTDVQSFVAERRGYLFKVLSSEPDA